LVKLQALEEFIASGARYGFNQHDLDLVTRNYVELAEELRKERKINLNA
jgi:hypothetical protein